MWKRLILALVLLFSFTGGSLVHAEGQIPDIEVFDIAKGEVVKKVANTVDVQKEIQVCLESITNLIEPLKETPKEGKIVRIPLDPPILLENKWFSTLSHEVFLILLPSKKPFFIVFSQDRKPFLADFSKDPSKLLKLVEVNE